MSQPDLFMSAGPPVTYYPRHFQDIGVDAMIDAVPLQRYDIQMYGKTMPRPRDEAWFHTDPTRGYRFGGGAPVMPHAWDDSPILELLKMAVEAYTCERFDSCFVNVYRSGADSIDWHADDDNWIGPVIASVSLGAPRKFSVKRKDKTGRAYHWMLGHGDLLVMRAGMQDEWLHSIRKTAKTVGVRLNATFRQTRRGTTATEQMELI